MDSFIWGYVIGLILGGVVVWVAMMGYGSIEEPQYIESWECVEWGATIDDLFIPNYIILTPTEVEYAKNHYGCEYHYQNNGWECSFCIKQQLVREASHAT